MIGNDIIDLKLASVQSNWQRSQFLNKIFTKEEQATILNASNPFQLVWLFWSMKESAYKIHVQKHGVRFFAPQKFRCEQVSDTLGSVVINNESYHTKSKITHNYIFTQAVEKDISVIKSNCFKIKDIIPAVQSNSVYDELTRVISQKNNIPLNALQIRKNMVGIPTLFYNNKQLDVLFSLSHHGNYGAYSFLNTPI